MTQKDDEGEVISKRVLDWLTGVSAIATILTTLLGFLGEEQTKLWAFIAALILAIISSGVYLYQRRTARLKITDSHEPSSPNAPFREYPQLQKVSHSSTPHRLKVFICHSSNDKPIVRELCRRLSAEDWIDPWLDEEKLLPGQDWDMEIEKAVEVADAVIVCLSNNSVTKEGYVQRELRFVLDIALEKPDGSIFIVPLRLDDCQPPRRLRMWQYVDYFPKELQDRAYTRLRESLEIRANMLRILPTNDVE